MTSNKQKSRVSQYVADAPNHDKDCTNGPSSGQLSVDDIAQMVIANHNQEKEVTSKRELEKATTKCQVAEIKQMHWEVLAKKYAPPEEVETMMETIKQQTSKYHHIKHVDEFVEKASLTNYLSDHVSMSTPALTFNGSMTGAGEAESRSSGGKAASRGTAGRGDRRTAAEPYGRDEAPKKKPVAKEPKKPKEPKAQTGWLQVCDTMNFASDDLFQHLTEDQTVEYTEHLDKLKADAEAEGKRFSINRNPVKVSAYFTVMYGCGFDGMPQSYKDVWSKEAEKMFAKIKGRPADDAPKAEQTEWSDAKTQWIKERAEKVINRAMRAAETAKEAEETAAPAAADNDRPSTPIANDDEDDVAVTD